MAESPPMVRSGDARLIGRGWDGLLVGWLAVAVWLALDLTGHANAISSQSTLPLLLWVGAIVTAAHFGVSYHLAYGRGVGDAVRSRPWALGVAPVALLGVLAMTCVVAMSGGVGDVQGVIGGLITTVYLFTTWHYVKQVYGVGRVGAAFAKVKLSVWEVRVLRYGLYPIWLLGAATILMRGVSYRYLGFSMGVGLLPNGVVLALRVVAIAMSLPLAVVFVRIAVRRRRLPPSLMLAPYVATVLWLAVPSNPFLTLLLLAPFHALQYLAIAHRAEVSLASTQPGRHGVVWWVNIFGGATAGGLLLDRWLPHLLDAHAVATGGPQLATAAVFVFLNLHHYVIDATIWRSKGDLVKAVVRGPVPTPPAVTGDLPAQPSPPAAAMPSPA